MASTTKTKTLAEKLAAIRQALAPMGEKNGKVQSGRGPNYDYHKAEDVQAHVRGALIEHNVLIVPKVVGYEHTPFATTNGAGQFLTTAQMEFELIDADSGEALTVPSVGSGTDSGEKGIYKAQTGAWKYLLLTLFQLAATDDPDEAPAAEPRKRQTTAKAKQSKAATPKLATAQEVDSLKSTARLAGFGAPDWTNLLTAVGVADETQFPADKLAEAKAEVFRYGAQAVAS